MADIQRSILFFSIDKEEIKMTPPEIKALIAGGEGLHVDFKQSVNTDLAKSISSFANARGGKVIIGVADDGSIVGYSLTNSNRSKIQDVAQSCDPPIHIVVDEMVYEDKTITVVDVPESAAKPHRSNKGFFLRQGSSSIKMSTNEILDFIQAHGRVYFDETVRTDLIVSQIFSSELIDKFRNFLPSEVASIGTLDLLASLKAAVGDHPTNTGILYFTPNPSKYITDATLKCVSYKSTDKVEILDNYPLIEKDLISAIEEGMLFLRKSLNMNRVIEGTQARDELEIPEIALREALVNALIHRDYQMRGGRVMVEVYADRVEISNPGSLPQGLSEADFGTRSLTRNPNIADLLIRTPYMERLGTGIQRIKREIEKVGLSAPLFSFGGHFSITVGRSSIARSGTINGTINLHDKLMQLTDEQFIEILNTITTQTGGTINGTINEKHKQIVEKVLQEKYQSTQLSQILDMPERSLKRYLAMLTQNGCIAYKGAKKTGGYIPTPEFLNVLKQTRNDK